MTTDRLNWSIKVTHMPTGESITTTAECFRNQHLAQEVAIKVVRARLYAKTMELGPSNFVYDLPDDVQFPHELEDYKFGGEK